MAVATLENKGVSLIDTRNWTLERMLPGPNSPPHTMEFSPDDKDFVMTFGGSEPMCCWCAKTGQIKWSLPKTGKHAVYSPDGALIATTKSKSVLIVDSSTGKLVHQFDGHRSPVDWTFFSSQGNRVASSGKSQVWLWDVINKKAVGLVQEKKGGVNKAAFSPSGALFATVSMDGGVRLFDGQTGVPIRSMEGHEDIVWDLAFTGDEKLLVTIGFDHKVRIWEVASGKELRSIDVPEGVLSARFELSRNSRWIAVPMGHTINEVRLFDVETADLVCQFQVVGTGNPNSQYRYKASPQELAFSPEGKWLAALCNDGKTRVWSLKGI